MLLKVTLKCLSLRVVLDLLNQVVNVDAMWSFHHRIRHAWDVEVDVFLIDCKVELVRVWWCSITVFGRTKFLHCVCLCLIPRVSPFYREHAWRDCLHTSRVSPFYLKNQVLLANVYQQSLVNGTFFAFSTKTRSVSSGCPDRSQIGLALESLTRGASPKRLLNELSNWLLINCRTRLIIPFSPTVIVCEWDLWWWSRKHVSSFIQHFSSFQFFNF